MFCSTPTLIAAQFLNLNSFPVATFQFQREKNKNGIFTKFVTCKQMLFCDQNHQHFNQYFYAQTRNTISHTCHSTSVVSKRVQKSSPSVFHCRLTSWPFLHTYFRSLPVIALIEKIYFWK